MKHTTQVDLTSEDIKGLLQPASKITLMLRGGVKFEAYTTIPCLDFGILWNSKRKTINVMTSDSSWMMIRKKDVMAFEISELNPFED